MLGIIDLTKIDYSSKSKEITQAEIKSMLENLLKVIDSSLTNLNDIDKIIKEHNKIIVSSFKDIKYSLQNLYSYLENEKKFTDPSKLIAFLKYFIEISLHLILPLALALSSSNINIDIDIDIPVIIQNITNNYNNIIDD